MVRGKGSASVVGDPLWSALDGSCATVPALEPPLAEVIALPVRRAPLPGRVAGPVTVLAPRYVLTRRGRLVRTFVATFVMALLVLMAAARLGDPGDVEVARTAVVGHGQSLTDVASRELPALPTHEAVMAIRVFNDMGGTAVQAGQALRIPKL